jgi:hypothetical protein
MEERIQRKIEELSLERRLKFSFMKTTKQDLREEAVRKVEEDIQKEEELKQKIQKQREENQKAQERMQQDYEKRQREKEQEESREKQKLLQNKEDPDMPLTLKDLREIKGFDYDAYRRAYDELNVEMLKRIAREKYPHKFKRPYENQ